MALSSSAAAAAVMMEARWFWEFWEIQCFLCVVLVGSESVSGTQTVETQLENCQGGLTVVKSATLPKHGKVFIVSADGVLHQVRN